MREKLLLILLCGAFILPELHECRRAGGGSRSSGGSKSSGRGSFFSFGRSKPSSSSHTPSYPRQPSYTPSSSNTNHNNFGSGGSHSSSYPRQPAYNPSYANSQGNHNAAGSHFGSSVKSPNTFGNKNSLGAQSSSGNNFAQHGSAGKYSPHALSPSSKAADSGWKISPKTVSNSNAGHTAVSPSLNSGYGRTSPVTGNAGNNQGYGWKPHVTNPAAGQTTGNSMGWKPGVGTAAVAGAGAGAGVGLAAGSKLNSGSSAHQISSPANAYGHAQSGTAFNTNSGYIPRSNTYNTNNGYGGGGGQWNANTNTGWNPNSHTGSSWNSHARYPTQGPTTWHSNTPYHGTGNTHITNNVITSNTYVRQTPNIHVSSGFHVGVAPHFVSFGTYNPYPYYCSWLYGCPRYYSPPLFGAYSYSSTHHHYHNNNNNNNNGNQNNNNNNVNNNANAGQSSSTGNQLANNNNQSISYTSQPVIYKYESINQDSDDSSEIKFLNPYLIVGVENMVIYGEFQNNKDITLYIEQDSDGMLPFYLINEPVAPTSTTTAKPFGMNKSEEAVPDVLWAEMAPVPVESTKAYIQTSTVLPLNVSTLATQSTTMISSGSLDSLEVPM